MTDTTLQSTKPDAVSDKELTDQELDSVTGGEITFEYGALQIQYTQQNATGKP